MDERKYTNYLFLIFGVSFLIRLFIASFYGLTGDEAHYYQYAVHPSFSYFDHPPLVGYVVWPFLKILGNTPLAVRMPALISSSICFWLLFTMGRNVYSASCGFWAAVIFCLTPLFSVLGGIMTVPDTILSVFWLLSIMTLWKIRFTGTNSLWYLLGFLVGLSLLTKYTGFFLYLSIFIFVIADKHMRSHLKKKYLYCGFFISLLVFSPVLIWNYNNHWASFAFQFSHGLGEKNFFNPGIFIQNSVAQMAVISPFIWILLALVFINSARRFFSLSDNFEKLLFIFAFPVFAVFGYASLSNEILPHWPAPGYLTLIIPGANFLLKCGENSNRIRRFFRHIVLYTGALFTSLIPVQVVFHCLPLPSEIDPTGDLYGWDKAAYLAEYFREENRTDTFLFTHKFYLASQMAFYLPAHTAQSHLYCLSKRVDQYDFWQRNKNLRKTLYGKTGIFFTDEHFRDSPDKIYKFGKIEKPITLEIYYRNKKVKTFYFYKCVDFKTYETDRSVFNSAEFYERNFWRDLISVDNRAFLAVNRISAEHKFFAILLFNTGYLGSTEVAVLVVSLILFFSRRKDFLKYTGMFIIIIIVGAILVHILKEICPSPRPVAYFGEKMNINITGPVLKSGSFPSGHSQTAFSTAAFLGWLFPVLKVPFYLIAIAVAFSRVSSGVHFFRDILVGSAIGFIAFWIVLKVHTFVFSVRSRREQKENKI